MSKIYITTPAYYPNLHPHVGHAYTTIGADILARWWRLKLGKENVMFISGLDEHGEKLEKAARERSMKPQEFVDMMAKIFQKTWKDLNISLDGFIRTSEERHIEVVKKIFKKIYDAGDIYKGFYKGWYCVPCESFWTELQLIDRKCPDCDREVKMVKEESYFFRLSKYQKKLLDMYDKNPEFILPLTKKNEIINRVKAGLDDLSISRLKVKWGIPVPVDKKSTLYCWIDALSFYLSVLGYPGPKFKKFWPPNIQLMSKEINWFHSVIFPSLLMSAKIPLAKRIFIHGWLTANGEKMSKSKGNFIVPEDMVDKYGVDAFRYFLFRHIPFGEDGDFSEEALVARINGELVSDLGNLASRILTLAEKAEESGIKPKGKPELESKLKLSLIEKRMDKLELHLALDEAMNFVRATNKYINENEPWKQEGGKLGNTMYNLLESLRVIGILISPFMPNTAEKINKQLGLKPEGGQASKAVKPGLLKDCKFRPWKGKVKKGEHLFERVKVDDVPERPAKPAKARTVKLDVDRGCRDLGIKFCGAVISGVNVKKRHSGLERLKKDVVGSYKFKQEKMLKGYKGIYDKLKIKGVKHPIENLRIIIKKSSKLPTINNVVDAYNVVAFEKNLSIGAHDLDKIKGNVSIRITDGTEPYTPLGTGQAGKAEKGEYACMDDEKVICRMDIKQCDETKITGQTKNVFIYVQGNKATSDKYIRDALKRACENILKFCGGKYRVLK